MYIYLFCFLYFIFVYLFIHLFISFFVYTYCYVFIIYPCFHLCIYFLCMFVRVYLFFIFIWYPIFKTIPGSFFLFLSSSLLFVYFNSVSFPMPGVFWALFRPRGLGASRSSSLFPFGSGVALLVANRVCWPECWAGPCCNGGAWRLDWWKLLGYLRGFQWMWTSGRLKPFGGGSPEGHVLRLPRGSF